MIRFRITSYNVCYTKLLRDYLSQSNVLGNASKIDQATFLAGYLSAGMTTTGKVGTYVGILFPATQAFMDGYAMGVAKYNEVHGTSYNFV